MRRIFLVALMAGAMFALAAPTASFAAKSERCHHHEGDIASCVCPPGTENPDYCVRGTPRETAEVCARAGFVAAEQLTDSSESMTFSFKASVSGECHFTLLFLDPGSGKNGRPPKYVVVGEVVIHTQAGLTSTGTVSLNAVGEANLAQAAASHTPVSFEVIAVETSSLGTATQHLFGSFSVS